MAARSIRDVAKALGHIGDLFRKLMKIRHRAGNLLLASSTGFPKRPIRETSFAGRNTSRRRAVCRTE
ncbi:MAG: hypothetical protein ACJ750_00135 [Gaiellaceae bacterium]